MLINTLFNYEDYFKNFSLCDFIDSIKIIVEPWKIDRVGKDDMWGILLKYDNSFEADVYFLNEGILNHSHLNAEVGNLHSSLQKKFQVELSLRGLNDLKYLAKKVELSIKKQVLKKYNPKKHFNVLKMYSNCRDEVKLLIGAIFENGIPENIFLKSEERAINVSYNKGTKHRTFNDLKSFYYLLFEDLDEFFFERIRFSINIRTYTPRGHKFNNVFPCTRKDLYLYLFDLYKYTREP